MIATPESLHNLSGRPSEASIELQLRVTDSDVVAELRRFEDGQPRESAAADMLRVGALAIRQAAGTIDAAAVREAGARLIGEMKEVLAKQLSANTEQVNSALQSYFDPTTGSLPQRLERLTKNGGELDSVLMGHLRGDASTIARELQSRVGPDSPLLRRLSPDQSDGILSAITKTVNDIVEQHRTSVVGEFSLDKPQSALSRLVKTVTDENGKLRTDLSTDTKALQKEFSLDNPEGALSRLVTRFDEAQKDISSEFSLDNQDSALSKLNAAIGAMAKSNDEFQNEVKATLEKLAVRRQEAARGTAHGRDFEQSVHEALILDSNGRSETLTKSGDTAGIVPRCKKGDFVTELTAESAAPGARIVVEAKEDASYSVTDALAELAAAKRNRGAHVGVFIFSKSRAPTAVEPLTRHGDDIVTIWDAEDPSTDLYVKASMSLARALVIGKQREQNAHSADFAAMEAAIARIVNDSKVLADFVKLAETVKNNGEKIAGQAGTLQTKLAAQIEILEKHLDGLRKSGGEL